MTDSPDTPTDEEPDERCGVIGCATCAGIDTPKEDRERHGPVEVG